MDRFILDPGDWKQMALRVGLALMAGAVVGFDRRVAGKPAGMRTYMLVALGACLFAMMPLIGLDPGERDPLARVIQGVATGVGFLGAGEIFRTTRPGKGGETIRGLTSAAAIWVTAALGVAAACGLWQLCLVCSAITLGVLSVLKRLEPPRLSKVRHGTGEHPAAPHGEGEPPAAGG
jgi:putative Mg2+ transporter-C (MgtC) family protein